MNDADFKFGAIKVLFSQYSYLAEYPLYLKFRGGEIIKQDF